MRGRSSSAKLRLRSAGYKCNLCGKKLLDAATLEQHQKTIHRISTRANKVSFKAKPSFQRNKLSIKDKDKVFDDLLKEKIQAGISETEKILSNNEELSENDENLLLEEEKKSKITESKDVSRRVEFECPVCLKTFKVYFTAHKHIQKAHSVNADGKKIAPNSLDLVQPVRLELCYRCDSKMRSTEEHLCPKLAEEAASLVTDFVCCGCNQYFISMKAFDTHVAGLHCDSVDSMFFPTKIEYMNWRLEMERHTNTKYLLYGEYESKRIYRCNYKREAIAKKKAVAHICPSSVVVQDYSKGIQVHYYIKHFDHAANPYMLSSKYKKYSITSFLKNPNEVGSVKSSAYSMKLDEKDLYSQFKILMESIILNSAHIEVPILQTLIERALEMSTVLADVGISGTVPTLKPAKIMSDKEITEALEMKSTLHKRRKSADFCETSLNPAKRTRNQSLFIQSDIKSSPKILNTFSLASNSTSEEFKSDNGDDFDADFTNNGNIDNIKTYKNKTLSQTNTVPTKSNKVNTKHTNFNESISFNDSYKDFIDKNFIGNTKSPKKTVKTKLGFYQQTSPKKSENKGNIHDKSTNNKYMAGLKPISSINSKVEETNPTSKLNMIAMETPKVNILSMETPNVTISKVSSAGGETPKTTNAQLRSRKLSSKVNTSNMNSKGGFSHLVDPYQVNITKVSRSVTSSVEPLQGSVSNVNTRNILTITVDPLEPNTSTKVKTRKVPSPLIADSHKGNTTKVNIPKEETFKVVTPKLNTIDSPEVDRTKMNITKVYTSKVTSPVGIKSSPKAMYKVTFEDEAHSSARNITPQRKRTELKYEVRERENDCNILVLKF